MAPLKHFQNHNPPFVSLIAMPITMWKYKFVNLVVMSYGYNIYLGSRKDKLQKVVTRMEGLQTHFEDELERHNGKYMYNYLLKVMSPAKCLIGFSTYMITVVSTQNLKTAL